MKSMFFLTLWESKININNNNTLIFKKAHFTKDVKEYLQTKQKKKKYWNKAIVLRSSSIKRTIWFNLKHKLLLFK